ncbi:MAG: hypothetical protein CM15mP8_0410 [Methanobacteriota archaeon]|nr:MAG: hypothetical protein CM15mP8_0410 [Euryarchaeota archaeon]
MSSLSHLGETGPHEGGGKGSLGKEWARLLIDPKHENICLNFGGLAMFGASVSELPPGREYNNNSTWREDHTGSV